MREGNKVRFVSASDEQVNWGSRNADPRKHLVYNEIYVIDRVDVHSWHTKVYLQGFGNLPFNSVHFEVVTE